LTGTVSACPAQRRLCADVPCAVDVPACHAPRVVSVCPWGRSCGLNVTPAPEPCPALLPVRLAVFGHVHTGCFLPRAHLPHLVRGLERESVSGGCGTLGCLSRRVPHPWAGRGGSQTLAGQAMVRTGNRN